MQKKLLCFGLCDNSINAARFFNLFKQTTKIDWCVVIANNQNENVLRWASRQLMYLIKVPLKQIPRLLAGLLSGKLRIYKHSLNDQPTYNAIREKRPDLGLHMAGIIYKQNIIDSFSMGILNAHIGILPTYRGRCVMEWSILYGDPTGVSTFFIDRGIDTGKNIVRIDHEPITLHSNIQTAKRHLFSQDMRCYEKAINAIVTGKPYTKCQQPKDGIRFYVISDLLRSVVEEALQQTGGAHP